MNSRSKRPSADANIDELQAWASVSGKAAAPLVARPTATSSVAATADAEKANGPGLRGVGLLPKVLLAVGIGLAAYLVFSVLVGLLMMMLMVVGGAALLYGAYRVGRRQGRREGYNPDRDARRAVPSGVHSAALRQFRRGRGRGHGSRQDG